MLSIGRWLSDARRPDEAAELAWLQLAFDTIALLGVIAGLAWLITLPTF